MGKSETIRRINRLKSELVKTMRRHAFKHWMTLNMSMSQVKSLFCVIENEHISSKKLADMLEVTPANITGIIDRLIAAATSRRTISLNRNPFATYVALRHTCPSSLRLCGKRTDDDYKQRDQQGPFHSVLLTCKAKSSHLLLVRGHAGGRQTSRINIWVLCCIRCTHVED